MEATLSCRNMESSLYKNATGFLESKESSGYELFNSKIQAMVKNWVARITIPNF